MLFSEPKISQLPFGSPVNPPELVSVLFSEPKISQYKTDARAQASCARFSALQRAENFSILVHYTLIAPVFTFQCSSASRKFLNLRSLKSCISAASVSVLFSEPKISQFRAYVRSFTASSVSVLFSEPKISQSRKTLRDTVDRHRFSALQRAENFSIFVVAIIRRWQRGFSALQRAENFSIVRGVGKVVDAQRFQCSSASRKFLNPSSSRASSREPRRFQCSSASRKFLN